MQPLPNWAFGWLLARDNTDPGAVLATITHPSFATMRLVRDKVPLTSRGQLYTPAAFNVNWVNDDGNPTTAQFTMPNSSPEIGRILMRIVDPVEVALEAISLAHPDEPIAQARRLQLLQVTVTAEEISGSLSGKNYANEPLGTKRVVPPRFPAMFRRRG